MLFEDVLLVTTVAFEFHEFESVRAPLSALKGLRACHAVKPAEQDAADAVNSPKAI